MQEDLNLLILPGVSKLFITAFLSLIKGRERAYTEGKVFVISHPAKKTTFNL